jgi:enamine deaminase RidA (YjgF/YER057c/UK114 family)
MGLVELCGGRIALRQRLHMTRDEVLREEREQGSPAAGAGVPATGRQWALDMARVPQAAMVVRGAAAAVAIGYTGKAGEVPVVLAAGFRANAGTICDVAAVAGVIIGARLGQSQHVAENERLFSMQLDASDQSKLQSALSSLQKIPGDCGDEYRKAPFLTASGDLSHHIDTLPSPYPTVEGADGRIKALSGTIWEDIAGFSRAVRKGNHILVSGTTATHGAIRMGGDDPAAQMHFIIDKVEGAIRALGGSLEDVVRTRIFVQRESDWEAISRAHGQRFDGIQPANTLVQATLIGEGYLVEMETDALLS